MTAQLRLSSADNFNMALTHNIELALKNDLVLPPIPKSTRCSSLTLEEFARFNSDERAVLYLALGTSFVLCPFRLGGLYVANKDMSLCSLIELTSEEKEVDACFNINWFAVDRDIREGDILLFTGVVRYDFVGEDHFSVFTLNFLHRELPVFELVLGKFESKAGGFTLDREFTHVQDKLLKTLTEDLNHVEQTLQDLQNQ